MPFFPVCLFVFLPLKKMLNNRALFLCANASCRLRVIGRFPKLPIFISCYICSFVMTTGKEHDNLFSRVSLPSASNYRRMRGARAGFVLKVNILYIQAYPALLLSTKWTSGLHELWWSVHKQERCTHTHEYVWTHWHTCVTQAHTRLRPPAHTLTCRRLQPVTLFSCFRCKCQIHWEIRRPFLLFSTSI